MIGDESLFQKDRERVFGIVLAEPVIGQDIVRKDRHQEKLELKTGELHDFVKGALQQ